MRFSIPRSTFEPHPTGRHTGTITEVHFINIVDKTFDIVTLAFHQSVFRNHHFYLAVHTSLVKLGKQYVLLFFKVILLAEYDIGNSGHYSDLVSVDADNIHLLNSTINHIKQIEKIENPEADE